MKKILPKSFNASIENIISTDNPTKLFEEYSQKLMELFKLKSSLKHMRGSQIDDFETTS